LDADLFVPLLVRDQLIGILILGTKRSEAAYSLGDQRILATLANQTAVAIQNAWLYSLEQRKAEESVALLDIARAVSSTLDLTQMLEIIAQRTAEVCSVDRCSVLLLDKDGDRLLPLMSQFGDGVGDKEMWRLFRQRTYTEKVDSVPLIRRTLEGQEPIVFDSDLIEQLPEGWIEPFGIRSLLAVPLVAKDQAIGLMALDHTEEGRGFSDEQISLAATIGTQVSIAIENARLYEETIEEKERTETIVEQAFAGIMLIDPEGRVMTVNPEVEAITGYTSQELLGHRLSEVFGPEVWGRDSILTKVMDTGERVPTAESTLVGKNGPRDILLGVIPIREGFLLNFADISRLKEVDRLKTSIVANVSHELRAPLASIKAYTELLLDNLEGEDEALRHRFLSIIDQEADWLTELINDLLDLARLESEEYAANMELLSLREIIDGAMTLLDHQARRAEVAVNLDVPADLPLIVGDKELLTILIRNLVSNAKKFSIQGGSVDLKARHDSEGIVLFVVDRGMGIPAEDMPNLFTKFYRSSVSREAGVRGTGLGLVLAKEVVELHDGVIELDSELGVGTRVTVTLPVEHPEMVETRAERVRVYG
jgi:PAS domain S-box-containing protein